MQECALGCRNFGAIGRALSHFFLLASGSLHRSGEDQEQGPDDVTEEERDDMYMRAALNVFMSNRFSDSLPDSTLLGISGAELRELLGGAD